MNKKQYVKIDLEERKLIEKLYYEGYSYGDIGNKIGKGHPHRFVQRIRSEIEKNKWDGVYLAEVAQLIYNSRIIFCVKKAQQKNKENNQLYKELKKSKKLIKPDLYYEITDKLEVMAMQLEIIFDRLQALESKNSESNLK